MRQPRNPSYRLHKPSGQAVATFDGRDLYFGKYDSPESRAEYDRTLAEWLNNGRRLPTSDASGISVNELLVAYLKHADTYYVKNGEPTGTAQSIRYAIKPVATLYGHTLARDFGPRCLKVCRQQFIDTGVCRGTANKRSQIIVRVFSWAVEQEMIPPSIVQALRCVSGLKKGRCPGVKETAPVRPVADVLVDAIRPHVSPQVWGMIELMRVTGMRPGEVIQMRTCDIDTSGRIWLYRPASHKTEHHDIERTIYIGPKGQAILRSWLRPELQEPLFQPREAAEWLKREKRKRRKTPVQPSQQDRSIPNAKRRPGERYTAGSLRYAVHRACKKADVPPWHPNQLRHNAATMLRKEFGIETARVILGHHSLNTTELYAEADVARAADAMLRVG